MEQGLSEGHSGGQGGTSSGGGANLIRPNPTFPTAPYTHRDWYVAPVMTDDLGNPVSVRHRPWEGIAPVKPWEYRIVAGIAHIDQPEMLKCVIETLRLQTERPFIHVVDLGSQARNIAILDRMEADCDDLRIDHVHPRGWSHTSAPVSTAMDLVFASVDYGVEFCYSTHVDVFLKSRKYLAYLASKCSEMTPVVGYRMSPRKMTDRWRTIPSHTATLYHMPTMRRIRAQWSMHAAAERLGISPRDFRMAGGWPDTETNLGLILEESGCGMRWLDKSGRTDDPKPGDRPSWLCLGDEPNEPYETPWFVHERSYPSQALYAPDHGESRRKHVANTLQSSRDRVESWKQGKME